MREEVPILRFSSFTPKFSRYGLYLNASRFHAGAGRGAVWLHGVLSVAPEAPTENWLAALNVTVVSESNQLPQVAAVFGPRTLVWNHFRERTLEDGRLAWVLPFSLNLKDITGLSLYDDNFFVHVSARQYCSTPVRIVRVPSELLPGLDAGGAARFSEVNSLLRAYDDAGAGRFSSAVECFETAFASRELRADPDRRNLYNAAYCAAQAAVEAGPGTAERLLDKTAKWLQEDLQQTNELVRQIQQNLSVEQDGARKARLTAKRAQLLKDLGLSAAMN